MQALTKYNHEEDILVELDLPVSMITQRLGRTRIFKFLPYNTQQCQI